MYANREFVIEYIICMYAWMFVAVSGKQRGCIYSVFIICEWSRSPRGMMSGNFIDPLRQWQTQFPFNTK